MKHSLEDVVRVLRDRVGGQWEGSEADGRDEIFKTLRHELGLNDESARETFDALLATGQLRYRRIEGDELSRDDSADSGVDTPGLVAPVLVPGGVAGSNLNGPTPGGLGLPIGAGAGLAGGFWQIGRGQDDELPPMAGRRGQIDPTA